MVDSRARWPVIPLFVLFVALVASAQRVSAGERIVAKDGDVIVVRNDDRVTFLKRQQATVRLIHYEEQALAIMLADIVQGNQGLDGRVDRTWRFDLGDQPWPLQARWEGPATIEELSHTANTFEQALNIELSEGVIRFEGCTNPPHAERDVAAAIIRLCGIGVGSLVGNTMDFEEAERYELSQSSGFRQMRRDAIPPPAQRFEAMMNAISPNISAEIKAAGGGGKGLEAVLQRAAQDRRIYASAGDTVVVENGAFISAISHREGVFRLVIDETRRVALVLADFRSESGSDPDGLVDHYWRLGLDSFAGPLEPRWHGPAAFEEPLKMIGIDTFAFATVLELPHGSVRFEPASPRLRSPSGRNVPVQVLPGFLGTVRFTSENSGSVGNLRFDAAEAAQRGTHPR